MTAFQIRLQCFVVKQSWEGVVHGYGDGGGDAAVLWLVLSVNQADVIGFGPSAAPYYNNITNVTNAKKENNYVKELR